MKAKYATTRNREWQYGEVEGAEEEKEEEKGEKPVQAAGRSTFLAKRHKTPAILARFGSA